MVRDAWNALGTDHGPKSIPPSPSPVGPGGCGGGLRRGLLDVSLGGVPLGGGDGGGGGGEGEAMPLEAELDPSASLAAYGLGPGLEPLSEEDTWAAQAAAATASSSSSSGGFGGSSPLGAFPAEETSPGLGGGGRGSDGAGPRKRSGGGSGGSGTGRNGFAAAAAASESVDVQSVRSAHANCLAGAVLGMGFRFAGSADPRALATALFFADHFKVSGIHK